MGTFSIFALVLTTVYIVYFVVMVARDLLAARGDDVESESTEILDTSFMDEQTVHVAAPETPVPEETARPDEETIADFEDKLTNLSPMQPQYECALNDEEFGNELDYGDCKSSGIVREVVSAEETSDDSHNRDQM